MAPPRTLGREDLVGGSWAQPYWEPLALGWSVETHALSPAGPLHPWAVHQRFFSRRGFQEALPCFLDTGSSAASTHQQVDGAGDWAERAYGRGHWGPAVSLFLGSVLHLPSCWPNGSGGCLVSWGWSLGVDRLGPGPSSASAQLPWA